jgi:RNA polymerase-binding transcription factor DksA
VSEPTAAGAPGPTGPTAETDPASEPATDRTPVDLDAVERDLAGVEAALARLDEGTYWTDEVTGAPLPDDLLAADPTARRAP